MEKLHTDKVTLRKFGNIMGVALLVIALIVFFKHRQLPVALLALSILFFILGACLPSVLRLPYIAWMRLAFCLGWINTRILLFFLFYLIFTPIGLGMRLFGVDLLGKRIEKGKLSYWKKKEQKEFVPAEYEHQF